ncbi:hypothetical protein [Nocardiopsis sp. CC223A]|uniref:hypothetical protein n=1 Tax=Nocardiopsis sp. CC223A TaxID=3044051 RepID=UPI00278BC118|nr:hypothetical protein [Nocardiopsis sp. CC223A]
MARYRYLNCSELVAARWLASEALRWRRPRRAARARMYVTHPGRDLAPLTLVVRQWLDRITPHPEPTPITPELPLPLPGRTDGTAHHRPRVPEPRTSPTATAAQTDAPVSAPASVPAPSPFADLAPEPVAGPGFAAALASRPRIQALREGGRSRADTRTRPGSPTAKQRAAARLRARTAAFRTTTHLTADRDGLWKDAMAAARMAKGHLRRAA